MIEINPTGKTWARIKIKNEYIQYIKLTFSFIPKIIKDGKSISNEIKSWSNKIIKNFEVIISDAFNGNGISVRRLSEKKKVFITKKRPKNNPIIDETKKLNKINVSDISNIEYWL